MRARQLAEPFPTVRFDDDAREAAQRMADEHRPGLIVLDDDGYPHAVLPGPQVLGLLIPRYVQEDPALARAFSEQAADELIGKLVRTRVGDLLPRPVENAELPVVDADATTLEVAAVMAAMHSPIVAVVDGRQLLGAVTVSRLLRHLLASGDQPR